MLSLKSDVPYTGIYLLLQLFVCCLCCFPRISKRISGYVKSIKFSLGRYVGIKTEHGTLEQIYKRPGWAGSVRSSNTCDRNKKLFRRFSGWRDSNYIVRSDLISDVCFDLIFQEQVSQEQGLVTN